MPRLSSLFFAAALLLVASPAFADRNDRRDRDADFRLVYESTDARRTTMSVDIDGRPRERDRLGVRVSKDGRELFTRNLPVTFATQPGRRYRVEVFTKKRVYFDRTFEALPGADAELEVAAPEKRIVRRPRPADPVVIVNPPAPPPPPSRPRPVPVPVPAPTCVPDHELSSVMSAVKAESFSNEKLTVLRSAMRDRIVCADQVVRILKLFTFSKDQLEALRIVGPRLLDRHNAYRIYGAFTFSSDKKKAQEILER